MKKFIIFVLLILLSNSAYAKEDRIKTPDNFQDLGRYIETFETVEEENIPKTEENYETFEEDAIIDVAKRYEENAVELKLDTIDDNILDKLNHSSIFKIHINKDKYNIESSIRNENMIWDSSKAFSNAFYSGSRYMAPIPSVINSSKIIAQADNSLTAEIGQTYLYDALGTSALFIRGNESTYNTGTVLAYRGNGLNLATGSFSSSYNHSSSGGAIISTNSINLPFNTGSIVLGGGCFINEADTYNKYTTGGFAEYRYKRLRFNAQIAGSRYSNNQNYDTSLYFIPEIQLTDSLYFKTKFIRNISEETMQDEAGITYRPKNNNSFEFEINTSNQYNRDKNINRRIKFSTSYKF